MIHAKSKHRYTGKKAFRNHVTTLVCCSASRLTLSLMIILEMSWSPGPYARNGPDNCPYLKPPKG